MKMEQNLLEYCWIHQLHHPGMLIVFGINSMLCSPFHFHAGCQCAKCHRQNHLTHLHHCHSHSMQAMNEGASAHEHPVESHTKQYIGPIRVWHPTSMLGITSFHSLLLCTCPMTASNLSNQTSLLQPKQVEKSHLVIHNLTCVFLVQS